MSVFRFRDFQFDTVERRLTRNGEWVDLTPKAMDILEVFVARPGQLITRDEIIGKVWGNTLVEEGNLSVHISKLRKALEESRDQRFIQTLAGVGYRFTASVDRASNGHTQTTSAHLNHTSNGNGFHGDSEAIRLHLRGRHFFAKHTFENVQKSIGCFEKSIRLDPSNVSVYVDLIAAYRFLHFLDGISNAELAHQVEPFLQIISELKPDEDLVQVTIGEVRMYCNWEFEKAKEHFLTALSLNSDCLPAHRRLTELLVYSKRFSEAIVGSP